MMSLEKEITDKTKTISKDNDNDLHCLGKCPLPATSSLTPTPEVSVAEVTFKILDGYVQSPKLASRSTAYYRYVEKTPEELYEEVEYDMDEEDCAWLELVNEQRAKSNLGQITMDTFELVMDRFEKESFFQCQTETKVLPLQTDEDAICAVCLDGECYNNNVILFCDLCNLPVHQKCYGVPSIPDGSWVCQRCLLSPSKNVECCLCPNKRGAMKQADDGRWAHVACSFWIPEVEFANATFLEPIVGINDITVSRWKLVCYICKQRGSGACIQCSHASCYVGFHVTCAQQAGLALKKEIVKDSEVQVGSVFKKSAFCDEHSAKKDNRLSLTMDPQILKHARKILSENRNANPPLFFPVITVSSIAKISRKTSIEQKEAFISRLHCYWTLKRQSRNGMPLLRSRQFGSHHKVVMKNTISNESQKENQKTLPEKRSEISGGEKLSTAQLNGCHRLRQDLEKVRLLIELVRKREKLKTELMRVHEYQLRLHLQPLLVLFHSTLDKLEELNQNISSPVEDNEEGRLVERGEGKFVKLDKMREKIDDFEYHSVDDFESDFLSLVVNSMKENRKEELEEFKLQGSSIIDTMRNDFNSVGYDLETALHEISSSDAKNSEHASENVTPSMSTSSVIKSCGAVGQASSAGRGRGRPKKKPTDDSLSSSRNPFPGDDVILSERSSFTGNITSQNASSHSNKTTPSSAATPSGVNRRTAVLFNNKTRKSAKHFDVAATASNPGNPNKESKPQRRPGRPPKSSNQRSVHGGGSTSCAVKERPFMLEDEECVGFGDRDLAEKCTKRRSSTNSDNCDFLRVAAAVVSGNERETTRNTTASNETTTDTSNKASPNQKRQQYQGVQYSRQADSTTTQRTSSMQHRGSSDAPSKESFLQYRNMSLSVSDAESRSNDETSSSSSSQSDCESSSSQDSSSESHKDSDDSDSTSVKGSANDSHKLKALDLVWAKCHGYPWYPAQVIDPKTSNSDCYSNGCPVPVPPEEVINLQKKSMILVLFFDAKRTWQWLPRNKLVRLGEDSTLDTTKLSNSKKPNVHKAVQCAYDKAMHQKRGFSSPVSVSSGRSHEEMDTK